MIGMDITPEMLEQARIKLARLGLQDRIELRIGDAEHIDLPDNSIDGCCSAFMVRNLTDIKQGFRETLRVVRPVAAWSAWRSVILQAKSLVHYSISIFISSPPYLVQLLARHLKSTTICQTRSPHFQMLLG